MTRTVRIIEWGMVVSLGLSVFAPMVLAETPSSTKPWWDRWLDVPGQVRSLHAADPPVTVQVGGELRYRLELRDDLTFNDASYEDDAVNLLRTRLHADLRSGSLLRFFAEGQDSESFASSGLNRTNSFVDRLDLHQLFVELHSPLKALPLGVRIGRQELSYGDQRFVGAFDWSNVARVFDAAKLMWTPIAPLTVDAWFSQVVLVDRVRPDSADHGENFYGVYASLKPAAKQTLDAFLFVRHDRDNELIGERTGERGQLKEYTLGNRFTGAWRDLDYGVEWAWQFGSRAHDAIRAWAWHQLLGYTFSDVAWKPRVGVEFNHGSGDGNPRNGTVGNFDNLFPTNHPYYGYMDLASLRNLNHIELNLSAAPLRRLSLGAKHHWFFLDSNKSAWFNAGQGVIRAATPNASRTIGQETDLTATFRASEHLTWLLGYSYFQAGAFIHDSGADDNAHFMYLQSVLRF